MFRKLNNICNFIILYNIIKYSSIHTTFIIHYSNMHINIFVCKFQDFNAKLLTPSSTAPLWLQFPCVMANKQLIFMNILIES